MSDHAPALSRRLVTAPAPASPAVRDVDRSSGQTVAHRGPKLDQVQALRAAAVGLVVLYHLWPNRLSGGFVGVDVFFVISGFLMTRNIVAMRDRGVPLSAGLRSFYTRRIFRILPAATLVLACVTVIILLGVSQLKWMRYFQEVVAASGFLENWWLAHNSTDYLTAAATASPVEHFWSLSVEEQFYLGWPVLLMSLAVLAPGRRKTATRWVVVLLIALSGVFSVYLTAVDQPAAYFNTFARLWEFAVGAAVALFGSAITSSHVRALVGWVGLGLIAFAAWTFSSTTPFPGWPAIVPTAGAAAVILSSSRSAGWGPHRLMAWRPVQEVGSISYSIYLWHVPLIVLFPDLTGRMLDLRGRLIVLALTGALAFATTRWVENPIRRLGQGAGIASPLRALGVRRLRLGQLVLAGAVTLVLATSLGAVGVTETSLARARTVLNTTLAATPACFGAGALGPTRLCGGSPLSGPTALVVPSPLIASEDFPEGRCQQTVADTTVLTCHFGSDRPNARQVAIVGDSHASQWVPALSVLADEKGWSLTSYLKARCVFQSPETGLPACRAWNASVLADLSARHFDYVVTSGRSGTPTEATAAPTVSSVGEQWRALINASDSRVIAVRDIPQPANTAVDDVPTCVHEHPDADACTFDRSAAEASDLMGPAARLNPAVGLVDLNDYFCRDRRCGSVVGGVLVYLDNNHMTGTYSRTLVNPLGAALSRYGLT